MTFFNFSDSFFTDQLNLENENRFDPLANGCGTKASQTVERTGAVVKPSTLGREVPGSSPPVAVRCGLEQVTYPQLLR